MSISRSLSPTMSMMVTGRGVHDVAVDGAAAQKPGDRVEWSLGGRQADPLRRSFGEFLESLQRQGEVGTSLGTGHGVDLVEDDVLDRAEHLSDLRRGDQVERFGCGDEDVGWPAMHPAALIGRCVTGPEGRGDGRDRLESEALGGMPDSGQRGAQVSVDVVGECLERRDVEHPAPLGGLGKRLVHEPIERPQEGGQRLAGSGRRMDQSVLAAVRWQPNPRPGRRGGAKEDSNQARVAGLNGSSGCIRPL